MVRWFVVVRWSGGILPLFLNSVLYYVNDFMIYHVLILIYLFEILLNLLRETFLSFRFKLNFDYLSELARCFMQI